MKSEDSLRDALKIAAKKEKQAYRRATIYTAIPVLVGIIWLAYSVNRVMNLGREARALETTIAGLNQQVKTRQEELANLQTQKEATQEFIRTAQEKLQAEGHPNKQTTAALDDLSRAQANIRQTGSISQPEPPRNPTPTPSPTKDSAAIPNVEGLSAEKAEMRIKQAGFLVTKQDQAGVGTPGAVLYQDPIPGGNLRKGATIIIYVAPSFVIVPTVVGRPFAEAERVIHRSNLNAIRVDQTGKGAKGAVMYQDPVQGTRVAAASQVKLYVAY